ncbi:hypothetical protein [Aureimonas sp. AU22]|uniref:hypothetical protein n=1 Tax=Aureimonas sp. AU22 TaxID=1638162 RepID=UPI0007826A50|nr:hypothetical protein [Aureimonas sp. AU22]
MNHSIASTSLDTLAERIPADTPVHMLNLLRFRPGGRDVYFCDYVGAFRAILTGMGIDGVRPIWTGDVAGFAAGPEDEAWDAVLIVRYPSLAAFRAIVESQRYRDEALPHRLSAVADWRLIAQTEMPRAA